MRTRLLKRIALSFSVLGVALLGAEWTLRRTFPVRCTNYRLDPELLHTTLPRSRRLQVMPARAGGGRNLVRINSAGYRGPELDDPPQRPRIAVVGDSLVLAANVGEAQTFPARLGHHLGDAFEVVNAGLESYGPDQTLLKLGRDLDVLDPELVVLVLCATNDLGDLLRNKLFRLENGGITRLRPVLHPAVVDYFDESAAIAARPALARAWDFLWDSRSARAAEDEEARRPVPDLIPEYLQQSAWEYRNTVVEGDMFVYSLRRDVYDADVAIDPEGTSARHKRRLLTAVLGNMQELCSARGVPLAAVVVPSAVDLDPDFRIRVDAARYPGYRPTTLTDVTAACAREAALPVLDLYALFAANEPAQLFVGWDDIHWNARGIELSAAEVVSWLRAQALLSERAGD